MARSVIPLPFANKPTKKSAFLYYMGKRLPELKDQFLAPSVKDPSKKVVDIGKLATQVGSEWRSLSESDKEPYNKKAAAGLSEYEQKLAEWKKQLSPEDIRRQNAWIMAQRRKGKKGTALLRDQQKPKRPLSAFFEFMMEYRAQQGGAGSVVSVAKEAGEKWKAMSAAQKQPYEQKSQGAQEQYKRDLKTYQEAA
ncbi:HMG-box [Tilletiaria anomala UBC 951]|uniref:HMG-box n=1 Tax=Tilletiaria anomala (strain ATCC 24038 / CBS 436.72 / UBC 951) TaxID=1037660 RepID=A0A066VK08_TILAU|nr:HMG-box [Tilletiaria anomala UBC 951]KDN39094.1 HMG-box [Tilletiaria anomala UBC 951]